MHRSTPLNSALRGYTSGGARGVVDKVDDTKLLQEMGGNFMANETRDKVEAPQNYGFTSVVFDAEKDGMGKIKSSAEHFTSFMGGSRSFPVAIMDDRRHRMYKLQQGDTAMFRGRGDFQQFHMSQDGGFWTAPQDKTVRMQLLQKDSQSNSTMQSGGGSGGGSGGAGAQARDGSSGGSSGGSAGGSGQQQKGQESVYKDGQKSPMFVDVTKDASRVGGSNVYLMDGNGTILVHVTGGNVYLGAQSGKASFAKVMTESGPSVNVYAKIG
jgi:phage gp45-like